jgi:hypothetical protein
MADKDINIRVKAPGVDQVRQQINETAAALAKIPTLAQDINRSTDKAFANGLKEIGDNSEKAVVGTNNLKAETGILADAFNMVKSSLTGLLTGLAAFGTIRIGKAVIQFFDDLHKRQDEAVKKNETLRKSYEDLFEVLGRFDEQGRKQTVMETETLLAETSTSSEVGKPALEEYARQFKGKMSSADYQAGQKQMLGYAQMHGGMATPDLIQLMRGEGMNTTQQQDEFMRTIMGVGKESGLTDRDIIDAYGKSAPGARAMGMNPYQTLAMISTISAGEIGRNKTALPTATIDAMAAPNEDAMEKLGITGQNPNEIYSSVSNKASGMSAQDRYKLLQSVYGDFAAKGVYKLMPGGVKPILPVSAAAAAKEREDFEGTLEAKRNKVDALNNQLKSQTTIEEETISRASSRMDEMRSKFAITHPWTDLGLSILPLPHIYKDALAAKFYQGDNPNSVSVINNNNNNTYFNQTPPGASPSISPEDTY